jgi:hypothetical protein
MHKLYNAQQKCYIEEYEEDLSSALKVEEPVGSTPSPLDSPRPEMSLSFKDFQKLTGMGLPSPGLNYFSTKQAINYKCFLLLQTL